ncbi:MAG: lactonase family protein [Bryobacteraceae bacterium]
MSANQHSNHHSKYFLYVGSYGKGIHAYRFDSDNVKFDPLGLVGEIENPSFLASDPQHRYLYAVSELEGKEDGGVGAFRIDGKSGHLTLLNRQSAGGTAPCHLAVDHTSKVVMAANYGTGSVPVFPIESDGRLGTRSALLTAQGSSVNRERQEGPHAHEIVLSKNNRFVYVPDLGLDQIRIYQLDAAAGNVTPHHPAFAKEEAGLGPRHLVFSPDEKFAYVINELKSVVTVFKHDPAAASFQRIQAISSLGNGKEADGAAEILIDRAGKFLYASNRDVTGHGVGSIGVFAIDGSNGTLKQVQLAESGGTFPRGVEFDPTGKLLLVGDQKANYFLVFKIDPGTGRLTPTGQKLPTPSPVGFLFVPAE